MGKTVTFTHWYLGSALGNPIKMLMCLLLDLQRHANKPAVTADFQSEPRSLGLVVGVSSIPRGGPPALAVGVAGWVTPPPPQKACGGSCCCLLFPLCFPKNWVEKVGKLFLGRGVVSACQEEPLTHRRCFPVRRDKWFYQQVQGKDGRKLVHSSILCLLKIPLRC